MLERSTHILLLGVLTLALPACGYMTSGSRQQMAYAHYVRKMSHNRVHQKTKFKKTKVPKGQTSEPMLNGGTQGPQSVSHPHAEMQALPAAESQAPEPSGSPE